jgi:nicotinamidase-related amidase
VPTLKKTDYENYIFDVKYSFFFKTTQSPGTGYLKQSRSEHFVDKRGGKNTLETLDLLEDIDDDLDRLGITTIKVCGLARLNFRPCENIDDDLDRLGITTVKVCGLSQD